MRSSSSSLSFPFSFPAAKTVFAAFSLSNKSVSIDSFFEFSFPAETVDEAVPLEAEEFIEFEEFEEGAGTGAMDSVPERSEEGIN